MSKSIKYVVNEKKRTVVAIMEDTRNDVVYYLANKDPYYTWRMTDSFFFDMKEKYVGVAKCHEKDEFSPDYGKLIARTRLLVKYYEDFNNRLNYYLEERTKAMTDLMIKPLNHYNNLLRNKIELEKEAQM